MKHSETELAEAVRRLARASVLVIGDVMLDRYVYGSVSRISPEAPVPVLRAERDVALAGGAGNVVRNLTALGAAVALVSVLGDDQAGSDLTGLIGGQPNVEPWLMVQGSRCTTVKTRFVAKGQQLLRCDHEEVAPIQPKLEERMLRIAGDAMAATSVTVLSDYGKGVLAGEVPKRVIAAAKQIGRPVVAEPRGPDFDRFSGADLVVVDPSALAETTGMSVASEAKIAAAARWLRTAHGFGAVVVNRAAAGLSLIDGQAARHLPPLQGEVFDVSGAGDCVVAAIAAGLAAGLDATVAARLANLAMGVVIGRPGMAVARETDLLAELSPQGRLLRKIVTRDGALEQADEWRRLGWRVGLVAIGIDAIAAPAALATLETTLLPRARAACDRLVVAVTMPEPSAALVARDGFLETPPVLASLAALAAVDLVCACDPAGLPILRTGLHPDISVEEDAAEADTTVGEHWAGQRS